jgi:ABC-type Fe3+-hydroxamate transport system substrate-binding protein
MFKLLAPLAGLILTLTLTEGSYAQSPGRVIAPDVSPDQNETSLVLEAPPQRVVCLLDRCAQELAFIGAPVPVGFGAPYTYNVARDPLNFGEAAESAAQIDQIDGVDFEAVAALAPDLIIGEVEHITPLEDIAPVYTLNWDPKLGVASYVHDVRNYGKIFGLEAQTEARIQDVLDRVAAYAALSPANRTIAVIYLTAGGESLWLPYNCGLFVSQATPCARDEPSGEWRRGELDMLLTYNPDVIIVEDHGLNDADALAAQSANPLWSELAAVRNGSVHLVPLARARANSIAAVAAVLDTLMPLIYPETFPVSLTDEQVASAIAK